MRERLATPPGATSAQTPAELRTSTAISVRGGGQQQRQDAAGSRELAPSSPTAPPYSTPTCRSLAAFWPHFNYKRVRMDIANMGLALVLQIVSMIRQPGSHFSTTSALAFAVTYSGSLVACLHWARTRPASFAGWREVPATLLPLSAFLAPCTWEASSKAVADSGLWDRGSIQGVVSFWTALGFATMAPLLVSCGLIWPKRFEWHAVAQAACVAVVLRRVPDICAAPLLAHPASQEQLGKLYGVLQVALAIIVGPSPAHSSAQPTQQCRVSVSLLLVLAGLALPLGCSAAWQWAEYQRWHAHGERRAGPRAKPWWALSEHMPSSAAGQLASWMLLPISALLLVDAWILLLARMPE